MANNLVELKTIEHLKSKVKVVKNLEELPVVELLNTKVKVVNNLNAKISEVQVCYAESTKGRGTSYLYNFRTVDIESEEFTNWKNVINIGEIQSLHDADSTEYVYFGNNRGYWQVYFEYRGNDYKIDKNNANFNLEKKDQEGPVVIDILDHREGIRANFVAPSGRDYFRMQRGSPLERGVSVVIKSELRAEVSEVRLVYAECTTTSDVDIETEQNIVSSEEVSFDNRTLKYNEEILSTDRLVFSYHSSFWQLYFNYDGHFHKLNKNDARFDLKSEDNGKRLIITIGPQAVPVRGIPVKFSISSKSREFSTKTDVTVQIRRMRCQQLRVTILSAANFDQLKNLRNEIKQIIGKYPRGSVGDRAFGCSRLFFRNSDCDLVTDEQSKLKFSRELNTKEMISSLCELQHLLGEETRLSGILRKQLNEVENLSAGQVEITRADTQFLYGIGVVCGEIALVGIDQLGLIVRVGEIVECGLNLEEFEKALDDEMLLLVQCLKPIEPTTEKADMLKIQTCLNNVFSREFDKYKTITRGTIKMMREIASALHGNTRDVAITKGTGGVVGVAGGVLLIVGVALGPVTLGASTGLVITGITMMAASGALNIGASIGDAVARKIIIDKLKRSLDEKVLLKTLSNLTELMGTTTAPNQGSDPNSPAENELAKTFGKYAGNAGKFGAVGVAVGLKLAGQGGVQALRNAFRFSAVAVSIVFDLATVFDSTFTLATGAKSNLGYKWAHDTLKLEEELEKLEKSSIITFAMDDPR